MAVSPRLRQAYPVWPALIAAIACAAPLVAVAALAVSGEWSGYLAHLWSTRLPVYLLNTLQVTVISGGLAVVLGSGLAWLVARYEFAGRGVFEWLLALPLAVPAYAAAYGWFDLTQAAGPLGMLPTVRGATGAGLVLGLTLYPYVYLLAREAFAGQSSDAYEAARTLGARPREAFLRAAMPMARPAIAAGLALVVMETLADFGAVAHLGAPTLTVGLIRAWAGEGATADAARLALILVAIAFLIFALERAQRARARQTSASGRRRPSRRIVLSPIRGLAAAALCLSPVLLGMVIPLGRLTYRALNAPVTRDLASAAQNAVLLAVIAGVLAAMLGLAAAYALRTGTRRGAVAARVAGLGYAVPGAVAAMGVLAILGVMQTWIDAAWTGLFGAVFPVMLTGGIAALIFAYLSRFAAAAIGPADSALSRVTPTLDGAARTLGASARETARRVHWPLITQGALLAALLVFVEVLKELPATMILRPFNFDTLAVIAHNYASDERLGEAALPALLIAAVALPPMIWIARRIVRAEGVRAEAVRPEAGH
ncbi:iron ABC transporter permease [Hyphomonadaceae bacterium ML37]|nr:iron ABC transporter permease [Hyphomonadaceae bacterium ML37]